MTVLVAAESHLDEPDGSTWLARLDCERPEPHEALDWLLDGGHTELAVRMSSGLWRYWYNRPGLDEGRDYPGRALSLARRP